MLKGKFYDKIGVNFTITFKKPKTLDFDPKLWEELKVKKQSPENLKTP